LRGLKVRLLPAARIPDHDQATEDGINRMGMEMISAMGKRKMYNTTLDVDLIRQIKILAAQLEKRQNDLLEEAIKDLLRKYNLELN
jgi:hypothetical protein